MRTLTTFSAVIVLMAMSSSALAQGQRQKTYKRSCQEVCLERCKAKGPARHGLDACLSGGARVDANWTGRKKRKNGEEAAVSSDLFVSGRASMSAFDLKRTLAIPA